MKGGGRQIERERAGRGGGRERGAAWQVWYEYLQN